ncbi:MAG TPA: DUF2330 domain-containing protein [Polyangiaceae bacterium]|jgi:hypothetical protein|nr:DUF2330 domain-containing protein [Polyangiaceae bacterium]
MHSSNAFGASLRNWIRPVLAGLALGAVLTLAEPASAFCGFYVAGATSNLYANATMVVLMRDGTRTVLSIQNNYQGPPDQFAIVIPVPVVLQQDQVKTLPHDIFDRVDRLGSPRLVEYWEQDPCQPTFEVGTASGGSSSVLLTPGAASDAGVTVEAQFTVGEYDIVILSADDSTGLSTWLTANDYNIPSGADSALAPYVATGSKFFVAKVDPSKVTFQNGQAALSPLRFYYDTPDFSLPVRLGLLNSHGTQDLIVNILSTQRFEVANYPNVTIPTNQRVVDGVRDGFGGFYEALFSDTLSKNPGAVVTEYAWSASSCDPCPVDPLTQDELATLGADVTQGLGANNQSYVDYTLTRLHYRYTPQSLAQDLVFKAAEPIVGGRGIPDATGALDPTVQDGQVGTDTFQGRYVILHPWTGAISCASPRRGTWGEQGGSATGLANGALTGAPATASANLASLIWTGAGGTDMGGGGTSGSALTSTGSSMHASGGGCSFGYGLDGKSSFALIAALGAMFGLGRLRRRSNARSVRR